MPNAPLETSVTVTYDDSEWVNHRFQCAVRASKFAQELADKGNENIISILMKGLYGEREFILKRSDYENNL